MAQPAFNIGDFVFYDKHLYVKVSNHTDNPNRVEIELSNGTSRIVSTSKLEAVSPLRLRQIQQRVEQLISELEFFQHLEQFIAEQQIQDEVEEKDW